MNSLIKVLLATVFGLAVFCGGASRAHAAIIVDPSGDFSIVNLNSPGFHILETGDKTITVTVDVGSTGTASIDVTWDTQVGANGDITLAIGIPTGGGSATLVNPNPQRQYDGTSGAGLTKSDHYSKSWQVAVVGPVTVTLELGKTGTGFRPTANGVTAVPEPATMILLGTGLAGLAGARRRKSRSKAALAGK